MNAIAVGAIALAGVGLVLQLWRARELLTWARIHTVLAVLWFVAAFPIMLTDLRYSVPLLVFISVYANVAGHWSSAHAAEAAKEAEEG